MYIKSGLLFGEHAIEIILDENMQLNSTEVKISHESISIHNREKELGQVTQKTSTLQSSIGLER